jgi:hypothetical protein
MVVLMAQEKLVSIFAQHLPTNCEWYGNCLEKKYQCSGTDDDYAMEYAIKFCNLYDEHVAEFSIEGQTWVNAVRKCLQVSLVPEGL